MWMHLGMVECSVLFMGHYPASNLYVTHMGPMWAPIWAVQPGSIRVPYGLAHVNKIKLMGEAGADPGFLARGFKFTKEVLI